MVVRQKPSRDPKRGREPPDSGRFNETLSFTVPLCWSKIKVQSRNAEKSSVQLRDRDEAVRKVMSCSAMHGLRPSHSPQATAGLLGLRPKLSLLTSGCFTMQSYEQMKLLGLDQSGPHGMGSMLRCLQLLMQHTTQWITFLATSGQNS